MPGTMLFQRSSYLRVLSATTRSQHYLKKRFGSSNRSACDSEADARRYALHRPKYPITLLQELSHALDGCKSRREFAIDIGCGNGQLTTALARNAPSEPYADGHDSDSFGLEFQRVLGVDSSESQLKCAKRMPNVRYIAADVSQSLAALCTASGEQLAADCVCFAQSLHWFDIEEMVAMSRDALNESGLLAVCGYSTLHFMDYALFQQEFSRFYVHALGSTLPPANPNCLWQMDRRTVDTCFDAYIPVFNQHFAKVTRSNHSAHKRWDESQMFAYIESMSGVKELRRRQSQADYRHSIDELRHAFRQSLAEKKEAKMLVTLPYFLITAACK